MALSHTILFTVMPRGGNIPLDPLPVSVFVSPRLQGDDRLGAFPDWLHWTQNLQQNGLKLELRCAASTLVLPIDQTPLRPDLWEELFADDTLVRSHSVDDYSDRGVISFSMRQTLSALKSIYQQASVTLALPEGKLAKGEERQHGNRDTLRELVGGLEVHWNGREAPSWRKAVAVTKESLDRARAQQAVTGPLDPEGLIVGQPDANALHNVAVPFAVFHHMPTPKRDELQLDAATLFDFHQVLTALNSYPDLLRALGLVFDLDLPSAFVADTPLGQSGTLSVAQASAGWAWALQPHTPPLATAYLNLPLGQSRIFLSAPRALSDPQAPITVLGLLNLDAHRFGLAQVDVDGGMHKTIMLAETLKPANGHNLEPGAQPSPAPHPEVFDPEATLPALRSGGFSLFADRRALQLLDTLVQSKAFNDAVSSAGNQPRPFFAEDLVRGYRLDVWDSRSSDWHSLHVRNADYKVGSVAFTPITRPEEGFVQLAAMQPAKGAKPATNDLYLHEAIARWAGWSLSVPMPSKHLSRYPNAADAVPRDGEPDKFAEDEPVTPFSITAQYSLVAGSLPRLRFGARYRVRARAVDLAGNSLLVDDPFADTLARVCALPVDPDGFAYLRFEPVAAPLLVLRDAKAVTEPGSAVDRIVIRTHNAGVSVDATAADTSAAERHLVPPRTSVEMGERLGMFDDASGRIRSDAATWQLIGTRDAGELPVASIQVAGKTDSYPLHSATRIDDLPYLPDPLSRGAALRDLPGSPSGAIARLAPGAGPAAPATYELLSDPNPRPGSATLISFGGGGDWQKTAGLRFALAEPAPGQNDLRPRWDPVNRVLTVYLPKGTVAVVPLSSFVTADDLKLLGVWQWLREFVERLTVTDPQPQYLRPGGDADRIAHVLQRAVEGGHWMLTPPRLLTLVHAVQQPLGRPAFTALDVEHDAAWDGADALQTAADRGLTDPTELAPVVAWRRLGATDGFLTGALAVHAASTAKLDLVAAWTDPVDDPAQPAPTLTQRTAAVDELPLTSLDEGYLRAAGPDYRAVGYYDPEHDQIAMVRRGDWAGPNAPSQLLFGDAAPRHVFNDTKRHVVTYTAIATSRFREYFPQDQNLDFTRSSEPVTVDVPASARPLAPEAVYVLPTFGWQRQTETNLKRSVRFGGGLRVYLRRPWFSAGAGELLGVALWSSANGSLDDSSRDTFKPFMTQWGMDPIWQTDSLHFVPRIHNFADAVDQDFGVSLDEPSARIKPNQPGLVDVVGFEPQFDDTLGLWYADLTINTFTETYMPFVRLALVRYQPHALDDARISRVVLADFAQLTPDRSAMVTADPHHPRTVRVVVSGVAPRGPRAVVRARPRPSSLSLRPTQIRLRVQERDPALRSDLAWTDVSSAIARVDATHDAPVSGQPDLELWAGTVTFTNTPKPGQFRLLIEEHEYISANYTLADGDEARQPGRLIYAEAFELDDALVSET